MTFPGSPLEKPYFSPGFVDAPTLDDLIVDPLNALRPVAPAFVALSGFTSGYAANSFGYTPAYYLNSYTGKVELRGGVAKDTGTFPAGAGTALITLPSAIRPAQEVELACATSLAGTTNARVEIATTGVLTVYLLSGTTVTWISLDGLSYYLA